jgi:hypothetical protein
MPEGERQDPPKDDDQNDQPQGTQDSGQSQDSGGDTGQAGDQGDGDSGSGDGSPTLEEQLDAEKKKNIRLNKELSKAQQDKKKADQDRDAAKERDDLKTENDKLHELMDSKFLVWAIATDSKHTWQDAEDVVKFIKSDEINIDIEKGTVDGLDLALKRIAKDKPYLLVPKDDGTGGQPSGSHPVGSKTGSTADEIRKIGEKYKIPGFGSQAVRPV